jgi:hypothetical protein
MVVVLIVAVAVAVAVAVVVVVVVVEWVVAVLGKVSRPPARGSR